MEFEVRMFASRKCLSGELNHLPRRIHARGQSAWHGAGDLCRDLSITAAHIENVFVPTQLELGDEFARPGLLHDGIRSVICCVPFCGVSGRRGHESLIFFLRFETPYVVSYEFSSSQSRRFREVAEDVHALNGLATCTLDQIVLGAHDNEPAGARIESPRDFDDVCADNIFRVGQ